MVTVLTLFTKKKSNKKIVIKEKIKEKYLNSLKKNFSKILFSLFLYI